MGFDPGETATFDSEVKKASGPVVVKFYGKDRGPPCKKAPPDREEVSGELPERAKFVKVGLEDAEDVAGNYAVGTPCRQPILRGGQRGQDKGWSPSRARRARESSSPRKEERARIESPRQSHDLIERLRNGEEGRRRRDERRSSRNDPRRARRAGRRR